MWNLCKSPWNCDQFSQLSVSIFSKRSRPMQCNVSPAVWLFDHTEVLMVLVWNKTSPTCTDYLHSSFTDHSVLLWWSLRLPAFLFLSALSFTPPPHTHEREGNQGNHTHNHILCVCVWFCFMVFSVLYFGSSVNHSDMCTHIPRSLGGVAQCDGPISAKQRYRSSQQVRNLAQRQLKDSC